MTDIFIGDLSLDAIPPIISNYFPTGVGVPITTNIGFDVTDVGSGINLSSLEVTIEGVIAYQSGSQQNGFVVAVTPILDGYSVLITPPAPFSYAQEVNVSVYVEDNA